MTSVDHSNQLDFDQALLTPDYLADPYRFYRVLRENDLVHWSPRMNAWVLSRYQDVFHSLCDSRLSAGRRVETYASRLPGSTQPSLKPLFDQVDHWIGNMDHPNHTRLRKLVNKVFTPTMVEGLRADIEQLVVQTDQPAKIVIDENSGIIVMGRNVRVSTVAVAQSNLTVTITESPTVSQPAPLSKGKTTTVPRTSLNVNTTSSNLALVNGAVTLQELVDGLNALGIGPRDLISILQAIKATGARLPLDPLPRWPTHRNAAGRHGRNDPHSAPGSCYFRRVRHVRPGVGVETVARDSEIGRAHV